MDLLLEEKGSAGMIKFSMAAGDMYTAAAGNLSMVGSDGNALPLNDPENRKPHPRNFGAFPRAFRLCQREQGLFSLETAVHKMTGAPAKKLRLDRRGLIKDGFYADLVLFDPDSIGDAATYENPHQLATGIDSVFVNGKKAYEKGIFLNPKSGVLVKPQK